MIIHSRGLSENYQKHYVENVIISCQDAKLCLLYSLLYHGDGDGDGEYQDMRHRRHVRGGGMWRFRGLASW